MVIDTKIIASGKMYYAEKSNELYIESGRQGVYAYTIYKISDGKIQEEEVNSYDTSICIFPITDSLSSPYSVAITS